MVFERSLIGAFSSLFLFFCFFPYLDFLSLGTVTQPNALIVSIVPIFLIRRSSFPPPVYFFGIVVAFATGLLFFSNFSFMAFRDLMNYISLLLITLATYKILNYQGGLKFRSFYAVILTWLAGSILQVVYRKDVFSVVLHKVRGLEAAGKGLTSLSTEPTYYGLVMGLFLVIYLLNGWHHRSKLLGFLIVIQIFVFAKSSTVLAITAASVGIFIFINLLFLNIKYLTVTIGSILFLGLILSSFTEQIKETRMYELSNLAFNNPELVFAQDYSVSERINHAIFPIISLADNKLLPGGYGEFSKYLTMKKESGKYPVLFAHSFFRGSNRIQSGYGKIFFELGGLGLLVPFSIIWIFWYGLRDPAILFACIYFNLLLFAALPFMTATVPFIIGVGLYTRHRYFADKKEHANS